MPRTCCPSSAAVVRRLFPALGWVALGALELKEVLPVSRCPICNIVRTALTTASNAGRIHARRLVNQIQAATRSDAFPVFLLFSSAFFPHSVTRVSRVIFFVSPSPTTAAFPSSLSAENTLECEQTAQYVCTYIPLRPNSSPLAYLSVVPIINAHPPRPSDVHSPPLPLFLSTKDDSDSKSPAQAHLNAPTATTLRGARRLRTRMHKGTHAHTTCMYVLCCCAAVQSPSRTEYMLPTHIQAEGVVSWLLATTVGSGTVPCWQAIVYCQCAAPTGTVALASLHWNICIPRRRALSFGTPTPASSLRRNWPFGGNKRSPQDRSAHPLPRAAL